MSVFTEAEQNYLRTERLLARIATVGQDGTPHVTPVGWSLNSGDEVVDVGGINLASTKKFRDIARLGRAAIVIDDVRPPLQPRGIEIRGRAEAITESGPLIRIRPERIVAWGFDDPDLSQHARKAP
jgi:pyridoxamine 5'-phosphate oxidase family protein